MGAGLLTTLGVSIVIFLGTNALPGEAAQIRIGQAATEDSLKALREELGLNLPLYQQNFRRSFNFLQGEFGTSLARGNDTTAQPNTERKENTKKERTITARRGAPKPEGPGKKGAKPPGTTHERTSTPRTR
jgi:ABC-type dipeptide/oligopeptide/nickel transport systems, permease components